MNKGFNKLIIFLRILSPIALLGNCVGFSPISSSNKDIVIYLITNITLNEEFLLSV